MLELLGEHYYLNLERIDNFVNVPSSGDTEETDKIAFVKYEMIKIMTDVIMSETEDIDEKLGNKASSQLTIPFKLSWNTMLFNKFIEKI
jgi:hypothetical protein|tara:strand:+ start:147 stop:413 length:267 start_codon:yes stop_codon:yes gene_type:complete